MSIIIFCVDSVLYNWDNTSLIVLLSASQIFIISLLSKLILKDKIGKHKKAGLLIVLFGVFFSFVFFINNFKEVLKDWYLVGKQIMIQITILILGGISEVLQKYLLFYKNRSPYIFIFMTGLVQCTILLIPLIYYFEVKKVRSDIIFIWIAGTIFQALYHYIRVGINYQYTPTHRIISDCIGSLIMFIFCFIVNPKWIIIFGVIGYVACFIGSLIYNEIFILTLFNADKDTIDQINKRALLEEKETTQSLVA